MKNIIACLALLGMVSCGNTFNKPEKFLEKEQMVNLLYDLTLFSSLKTIQSEDTLIQNLSNNVVFEKYGLDSLSFAALNSYYLNQPEVYVVIYDSINKRLNRDVEKAESLPIDPADTIVPNRGLLKSIRMAKFVTQ